MVGAAAALVETAAAECAVEEQADSQVTEVLATAATACTPEKVYSIWMQVNRMIMERQV